METYALDGDTIYKAHANSTREICRVVDEIIELNTEDLPSTTDALILLKPNLNNDLNALTGNSTDLRLLVGVIKALQSRGYTNLIVADGPNCGTDHAGLDILGRLQVTKLARQMNVRTLNLNHAPSTTIALGRLGKVQIARIVQECDYLINLSKIKTHVEATMTIATKNLMGCLQGMDKRVAHWSLIEGLVELNKIIRPDLHIVDGLTIMEGDGPGDGRPRELGLIIAGKDNYLVDAFCGQLVGHRYDEIPYLMLAIKEGLLDKRDCERIAQEIPVEQAIVKANKYILGKIFLNNVFVYPRYWKIFDWIFNLKPVGDMLYRLHIRQDIYSDRECCVEDMLVEKRQACDKCKRCEDFCPMGIELTSDSFDYQDSSCIDCLYCYVVCPDDAIKVKGDLGYFTRQFERYKGYYTHPTPP